MSERERELCALGLVAGVVSVLGFVIENVWLLCTRGYINNRGMVLPALLGYGMAALLFYLLFGTPAAPRWGKKPLAAGGWRAMARYFALAFLCISLGELALGTAVEAASGLVWWNYTRLPLSIGKYTSLPTSAALALLATGFMHLCFPRLLARFRALPDRVLRPAARLTLALLGADLLRHAAYVLRKGKLMKVWKLVLFK